jgi:hypothetical protein
VVEINRRRTDRLKLTILLRVKGLDDAGRPFETDAHTLSLNRHGARIYISRALSRGQFVHLINPLGHRGADFRVVGPVSPPMEKGGEWGVECIEAKENIWGINFPAPAQGQDAEAQALLECRKCHNVSMLQLSLVEVDVLQTSGIVSKSCKTCDATSPWGYAQKQLAVAGPPDEAAMFAEARAGVAVAAPGRERRRHRRVSMQLPVRIRDYYGAIEITKSEDVSKGGFCFCSEKNFYVGEGILVVCPYSTSSQNIEVHSIIVRRQEIGGSNRKIYGVRYEPTAG